MDNLEVNKEPSWLASFRAEADDLMSRMDKLSESQNNSTKELEDSNIRSREFLEKLELTNAALSSGSIEKMSSEQLPIGSLRGLLFVQEFLDNFGIDGLAALILDYILDFKYNKFNLKTSTFIARALEFCFDAAFLGNLVFEKSKMKSRTTKSVVPKISLLTHAPLLVDCIGDAAEAARKKKGIFWKQPFRTQLSIKISTSAFHQKSSEQEFEETDEDAEEDVENNVENDEGDEGDDVEWEEEEVDVECEFDEMEKDENVEDVDQFEEYEAE